MATLCQGTTARSIHKPALLPQSSAARTWTSVLLPSLATAALLWLCYFPADCGWLAWIALVPLLSLVRSPARARRIYFASWLGGLVLFGVSLQWIRVADYRMYATWACLAVYCSFYVPLGIYLLRCLDRRTRLPLVISLPLVWTALEFFRAHFLLGGFPWYFLSHTQHAFLPIIQVADLAGAYAVTVLVAAVNACLFEFLYPQSWFRRLFALPAEAICLSRSALLYQTIAILVLVGAALGYGGWRLSQNEWQDGPRIALLQGNLDQRLRNEATSPDALEDKLQTMRDHFRRLCDKAAREQTDLIVWPETSFVYNWLEVSPDLPADQIPEEWRGVNKRRQDLARSVAERWQTNLLLGVNAGGLGPDARARRYNSAVLVEQDGKVGGRYDKMHCVPFGEYVPFRDWLPWMNTFAPYDFDYSITPGDQLTRFTLGKYHFGVVICFEDTDPYIARQYAGGDEKPVVDFLVNISNDGWFDGTSEHEEHLAICRFRAVECRRAIARAVNMGISAVIDGNGQVIKLPGSDWASSKKTAAVLTAAIPIDRRVSLYARWGDWLPWACWVVIGVGLVWGRLRPAVKQFKTV